MKETNNVIPTVYYSSSFNLTKQQIDKQHIGSLNDYRFSQYNKIDTK